MKQNFLRSFIHRQPGSGSRSLELRFVLPVILENLFTIVTGLVFTSFISGISQSSLTAIGAANIAMTVIHSVFAMLYVGAGVLAARHYGAGEQQEVRETIEQSTSATVIGSVLVTVACIAAAVPLMRLVTVGAEDGVLEETVRYFRILMLSLPFYELMTLYGYISRSVGKAHLALYAAVIANASQLILAVLLVKVLRLEVVGAGWVWVGCRVLSTAMFVAVLLRGDPSFSIRIKGLLRLQAPRIMRMLKLGIPVGIESTAAQLGYLIANTMSVSLGLVNSNVYQILCALYTFSGLTQGIVNAVVISRVGRDLGAGDINLARKDCIRAWWVAMISVVTINIPMLLLAKGLCGLYTTDAETLAVCLKTIWILPVMALAGTSINCIDSALRAGGDTRFVMICTVSCVWVIRLPLTWLFCFKLNMGVLGVYIANAVSLWARMIIGAVRYRGSAWYRHKV